MVSNSAWVPISHGFNFEWFVSDSSHNCVNFQPRVETVGCIPSTGLPLLDIVLANDDQLDFSLVSSQICATMINISMGTCRFYFWYSQIPNDVSTLYTCTTYLDSHDSNSSYLMSCLLTFCSWAMSFCFLLVGLFDLDQEHLHRYFTVLIIVDSFGLQDQLRYWSIRCLKSVMDVVHWLELVLVDCLNCVV